VPFELDTDRDLDGFPDWLEYVVGSDPANNGDRPEDANADGLPDAFAQQPGAVADPDSGWSAVSAGNGYACGLRRNGRAYCTRNTPFGEGVAPVGDFVKISAGSSVSCGIRRGGAAEC
jgi:hypothetical protein